MVNCTKFLFSIALSLVVAVATGNAGIVDEFTSDTLDSNWVQSTVLNFGTGTPTLPVFDTTTNDNQLTITGGGAGKQEVLLRDDFSLVVGEILVTDFSFTTFENAGGTLKAGIAIATEAGIETRTDLLSVSVYNISAFVSRVTVEHFDGESFSESSLVVDFDLGKIAGLYIERTAVDQYDAGYVDKETGALVSALSVTHTSVNNLGDAIGYYSDIRVDREAGVFDTLALVTEVLAGDFDRDGDVDGDDLTKWEGDFGLGKDGADFLTWQRNFPSPSLSSEISAVPEPSSLVLFTLAGLGYMACRKRRSNL